MAAGLEDSLVENWMASILVAFAVIVAVKGLHWSMQHRTSECNVQTLGFTRVMVDEVARREAALCQMTVDSLKAICAKLDIHAGSGPAKAVLVRALAGSFQYNPWTNQVVTEGEQV